MNNYLSSSRRVLDVVKDAYYGVANNSGRAQSIFVVPASTGNQIFRIMFAHRLQELLPLTDISGVAVPEWNIRSRTMARPKRPISTGGGHRIDLESFISQVQSTDCDGIEVHCFAQRLEYFAHRRQQFMELFSSEAAGSPTSSGELLIHVRAGDIVDGKHPDYVPLPISYYQSLIGETGLAPVFIGQLEADWYTDALRSAFPRARWIVGQTWLHDFQTIRNATTVSISVSTFAWLATWLSSKATRIYLPMLGIFNQDQRPDIDLLPRHDSRYDLRPFPVVEYGASEEQKRWIRS